MIDLGLSKMALIGVVALIVIGPEKLPRVARTVGTLLGKAQRYVNDVKAEVNRSMELDELRKMKDSVETAARDVEQSVRSGAAEFEQKNRAILEGERAAQAALPQIRAKLAALQSARVAKAVQAAETEAARQREAERKARCEQQRGWLDVLRRDPDCREG